MTFNEWALGHEPTIRLGAFFGIFAPWLSGRRRRPGGRGCFRGVCDGSTTWRWWC